MTDATPLPPIRRSATVPLAPDAAFALFTGDLAAWWPAGRHSLAARAGAAPAAVTVEPRVGGRILETLPDGTVAPWAVITDWTPGRRFACAWHPGQPEAEATDLAVDFLPVEGGTRVEITHGGFEKAAGETAAASVAVPLDPSTRPVPPRRCHRLRRAPCRHAAPLRASRRPGTAAA